MLGAFAILAGLGRRRLRRQSQPALLATQGDTGGVPCCCRPTPASAVRSGQVALRRGNDRPCRRWSAARKMLRCSRTMFTRRKTMNVQDAARSAADVLVASPRFLTAPLYRHWHLRWGATDAEVASAMPGDDTVPEPSFNATRAI